ncbi:MAG: Trm112 family protein [Thermoprotei archaeon]
MNPTLMDILQCPECTSPQLGLVTAEQKDGEIWLAVIVCKACKRWYPVINGIPHMLPDEMRQSEDKAFVSSNGHRFPGLNLSVNPPHYSEV